MKYYFYKTLVTITLLFAFSPIKINAAVNIETYINGDGVIPVKEAKELLSDILLHNTSILDRVQVEVSNIRKRPDMNIAFLYVGRLDNIINTEVYAITLNTNWDVIDGAMIGYDGDARLLEIPSQNQEYIYKPDMDIKYTLRGDSIIVTRTYEFASTARGGNYFHKNGTILNRFLIRKDGKIVQSQFDATADMTEGYTNHQNENYNPQKHSKVVGEFFGLGMRVLNLEQTPRSTTLNAESINTFAEEMKKVAKQNGRKTGNVENECVSDFTRGITNICLRDGKEVLSWIARNEGKESISPFILTGIKESGLDETEWLVSKVKSLKDKKARKWWQNWIKEQLGISE